MIQQLIFRIFITQKQLSTSDQSQFSMFSFDAQTKHHLVVLPLLVGQLELLFLPPERHLRKPYHLCKDLHLNSVVVRVLKPQRFAVVVLVVVRVTPSVVVQQVAAVPSVLVVVKLKLVAFANSLEHDPQKHPGSDIEAGQFNKYLALGLARLSESGPVHLVITRFDHSVANPEQLLAGVGPQHIFGLDFPGLENGLLSLLVKFLVHNFQLLSGFSEGCLLVLEFIDCSVVLVGELFVVLNQLIVATRYLIELFLQHCDLSLLSLDDLAVLILLGLHQRVELGVVHEHLFLYLGESNQNLLLEVLLLRVGVVDKFFHPVDLDEELGVFDLLVPQLEEPLFQRLGEAAEGRSDFIHRFAVIIHPHLDIQLLSQQKQVLLDLKHQLVNDPVHVLENTLPGDVALHLFGVLRVESPLGVNLGDVLEPMVQVLIVQLEGTHRLHLLLAALVDAESHNFLLMFNTPVLFALMAHERFHQQ